MPFEPGLAGGSRYIVIARDGAALRAVEHIDAPLTRAPLIFRWGSDVNESMLPPKPLALVEDQDGAQYAFPAPDPAGDILEIPARGEDSSYDMKRWSGKAVPFRLRLPRYIIPRRISISPAAPGGGVPGKDSSPQIAVDLSGLPPPKQPPQPNALAGDTGIDTPVPALTVCLVGDGYVATEAALFQRRCKAVTATVASLGLSQPIAFKPVFRASDQSGADFGKGCAGPRAIKKKTKYNAGYGPEDCRLLSGNPRIAWQDQDSVGASAFICLVNDSAYGGSSWHDYAWFPAEHTDFMNLLLHELGHMLGLCDEYDTPLTEQLTNTRSYANVTTNALHPAWGGTGRIYGNPGCTKLANHQPIGNAAPYEVAAFQGAAYDPCGSYRPTAKCKMRNLAADFCSVCVGLMGAHLNLLAATPP